MRINSKPDCFVVSAESPEEEIITKACANVL